MNKKGTGTIDLVLSISLLIAAIATIILQITFSGITSTKVETSLFSILQFIFSLAFTWVIARISFRNEFQESQKKFAISAYRRIIEINSAVNRLINRTISHMGKVQNDAHHELDVITEIGVGIRESIRSSISDWADIIGDEIKTIEKIQTIREEQSLENSSLSFEPMENKTIENEEVVEELISKLPNSLRITADDLRDDYKSRVDRAEARLRIEEKRRGYIKIRGFYESSLDRDIYDFKEGDILKVRIGDDNGDRVGALIAYDSTNKSVGVILNDKLHNIPQNYYEAVEFLIQYLGKSIFSIEILNIDRSDENKDRHYFTAKILDPGKNIIKQVPKNIS